MALNQLQLSVAEDLDSHILLTASAGTGKTNTLAYRISNIIQRKKAEPEEILCLTFTNKACNEMDERIANLTRGAAMGVTVRTMHSFCYDLIRAEAKFATDISWDFQVFDETDSLQLLNMAMDKFNEDNIEVPGFAALDWPGQIICNLASFLKVMRAEGNVYTGDDVADYQQVLDQAYDGNVREFIRKCDYGGRLQGDMLDEIHRYGARIVASYDVMLRENHGLDFDDLVVTANQLLQDQVVRKRWSSRYKYINIDEMQDISKLEYSVIKNIFADSKLLLCGDFFQTIYQWRGSEPLVIIGRFQHEYKPRSVVFMDNYRATRLLVNASFAALKSIFSSRVGGFYPQGIRAVSPEQGKRIVVYQAFDIWSESRWLYKEIHQKWMNEGDSFLKKVCIINRTNRQNEELARKFAIISQKYGKKLPFMLVDEFKFFRRQEIKDGMAFLRLVLNPHDMGSMKRVVSRFVKGVGKAGMDVLQSSSFRKSGVKLTDFIDPVVQQYGEPYSILVAQLRAGNVVVFDVESTGLDTEKDEIIQLAAIKVNLEGKIAAKFVKYLRAGKSVGLSEQVHHISDEMLAREGEEPKKVLAEFADFAKGCIIVGHNVSYDMTILRSQLRRLKLPFIVPLAVYDTLDMFRRFYPELPNHKLEFLGEFCKVKHKSSHDAYDDICATAEILLYVVEHDIRPTLEERRSNIRRLVGKFRPLAGMLAKWRQEMEDNVPLKDFLSHILMESGVVDYYKEKNLENEERSDGNRLENLRQLYRHARQFQKEYANTREAAENFLKLASLSNAEINIMLQEKPRIPILTVHQVKGSEFDYVYMPGCQEGQFPSMMSISQDQLEEEGRLFYVSITRAKKELTISYAKTHVNRGVLRDNKPSRYISAIPFQYVEEKN